MVGSRNKDDWIELCEVFIYTMMPGTNPCTGMHSWIKRQVHALQWFHLYAMYIEKSEKKGNSNIHIWFGISTGGPAIIYALVDQLSFKITRNSSIFQEITPLVDIPDSLPTMVTYYVVLTVFLCKYTKVLWLCRSKGFHNFLMRVCENHATLYILLPEPKGWQPLNQTHFK